MYRRFYDSKPYDGHFMIIYCHSAEAEELICWLMDDYFCGTMRHSKAAHILQAAQRIETAYCKHNKISVERDHTEKLYLICGRSEPPPKPVPPEPKEIKENFSRPAPPKGRWSDSVDSSGYVR